MAKKTSGAKKNPKDSKDLKDKLETTSNVVSGIATVGSGINALVNAENPMEMVNAGLNGLQSAMNLQNAIENLSQLDFNSVSGVLSGAADGVEQVHSTVEQFSAVKDVFSSDDELPAKPESKTTSNPQNTPQSGSKSTSSGSSASSGSAQIKTLVVGIDGTDYTPFLNHLSINQAMYEHHVFEFSLDGNAIEPTGSHTMDKSKDWIGKTFYAEYDKFKFTGIVFSVNYIQTDGFDADIVVRGYSPSVLLESGAHLNSWLKKSLKDIVEETVSSSGLQGNVKPAFTTPIDYMCQYRETHYDFLLRLANLYNEWMYYDGETFYFGKPSSQPKTTLTYGKDMDTMELSVRMHPLKSQAMSYQSKQDMSVDSSANDSLNELNEIALAAKKASLDNFGFTPLQTTTARVSDKGGLDDYLKRKMKAAAANLAWLIGTSHNSDLMLGTKSAVKSMVPDLSKPSSLTEKTIGDYMIYRISHYFGPLGEYHNSFEAIPDALEYLPEPNVTLPIAETQLGKVIDNNDPDKMGRIKVQLMWQGESLQTPWIRVMTPDGGKSDKVSKNRGYVFIPEKDDQVMIGFRYNDPTRPFVMGSMFDGTTGSGGGDNNKTKTIITRSGNTVAFDDEKGSITITDAKGNAVALDGQGNITVSSSASISLTTGQSSINMKENGTITISGKDVTINATTSHTETSPKVTVTGNDEVSISSKKKVAIDSMVEVGINGLAKTTVSSSGTTSIEGTIVKLN